MVYILLAHDRITAAELAQKLDVSVRTIYRYVDTLSTAGVPVYVTKGRNGGIALLPEFKVSKAMVNENEQVDILTSLKNMRDLDVLDNQALDKLAAVFQQTPVDWLKIDPTIWHKGDAQAKILARLREAILNHQFVSFQYLNSKNEFLTREVYPYQVVFKKNAWYLSGYALERQAVRTFKLSRLSKLTVTQKPHAQLKGEPWLAQREPQIQPVKQLRVDLILAPQLQYRVFEEFPKADITQTKTGAYEVVTDLNAGDWLVTYLLSFGSGLQVVGPETLRAKVRAEAQKILANY